MAIPSDYGAICHFHSTQSGWITFESNVGAEHVADRRGPGTYLGRMRADGSECQAWWIGDQGYVHRGYDLAGQFMFAELHYGGDQHHLAAVVPTDSGSGEMIRLTQNLPPGGDQRHHAHPILSPDRERVVFTATGDDGFSHIHEVDVSDLTA